LGGLYLKDLKNTIVKHNRYILRGLIDMNIAISSKLCPVTK